MALILHIDTATDQASTCISSGMEILGLMESKEQKNHASFLQPAIKQLLYQTDLDLSMMDAISVTSGPGSYTGLRVGMASAKGICYALQKPLIMVNTLEVMAQSFISHANQLSQYPDALLCPMIDARRMEIFTATYDPNLVEINQPHALIVEPGAFAELLNHRVVCFFGSGMQKCRTLISHPNALFEDITHSARDLAKRALIAYQSRHFSDLAYSEPLYVKEFFNTAKPL